MSPHACARMSRSHTTPSGRWLRMTMALPRRATAHRIDRGRDRCLRRQRQRGAARNLGHARVEPDHVEPEHFARVVVGLDVADLEYVEIEHAGMVPGRRRGRPLRSSHDLTTLIRVRNRRRNRGTSLGGRRAVAAAKLDATAIVADVADADEERAATTVLDDPREELVAVGAQMNRTADHAQREIVVDRQRPRPRAAAAPGGHAVLAQRAPALGLVGERRGAQHDERQSRRAARSGSASLLPPSSCTTSSIPPFASVRIASARLPPSSRASIVT